MAAVVETKNSKFVNKSISNIQSNIISITEDKLENKLNKHISKIKKSHDWIGAAGVFFTIVIALLTSQFKTVLGFGAEFWFHLFCFGAVFSFGYLCYTIFNAYKNNTNVSIIISNIKQ